MKLTPLNAVTPVDGRYRRHTEVFSNYFSEEALIRYRVKVEVEYMLALSEIPLPGLESFDENAKNFLMEVSGSFSSEDAQAIKDIEKVTNHDIKAVEYFIKEKLDKAGLGKEQEFIHFALTSQDINNTAVPMSIRDGWTEVLKPALLNVVADLESKAKKWASIPMLARTHGQPASPTTVGKEVFVFVERIRKQLELIEQIPFSGKFGGATGNFNAHNVAYPDIDWVSFANNFLTEKLGLERQQTTTQIEHYDNMAAFFDGLSRINTILIDLARDIWSYISFDYFKQKIQEGEVGSSAMPHKVNPIDFENAEGNLGMANAVFGHLSAKLPISRLQRDLTDSTVSRNVGVPFGHSLIALKSLEKGLGKLILNEQKIAADLENNWAVVAEAIQTILRRERYPKPYEALKALTRTNKNIDGEAISEFIEGLNVSDEVKAELRQINPGNYTGIHFL